MVILENSLHREAKEFAARHGMTLAGLIEEALRARLSRKENPKRKKRIRLRTFRGDGLQPGVSLDHMAGIYDRMEETE
jgi:hypothetical protein